MLNIFCWIFELILNSYIFCYLKHNSLLTYTIFMLLESSSLSELKYMNKFVEKIVCALSELGIWNDV